MSQPRILDHAQAKSDRVLLRGVRQLIQERLDGEHIRRGRQRAIRARTQSGQLHMQQHLGAAQAIRRHGVAAGGHLQHPGRRSSLTS